VSGDAGQDEMPVPMIAPTPRLVSCIRAEDPAQPMLALELVQEDVERLL